jgi:carbonic anhydrase/acetyltransferase-like protein (isoleucine patch superfamily)
LVPEGMEVAPYTLVMGAPAKVKREVTDEEKVRFQKNADSYVRLTAIYKEEQA